MHDKYGKETLDVAILSRKLCALRKCNTELAIIIQSIIGLIFIPHVFNFDSSKPCE